MLQRLNAVPFKHFQDLSAADDFIAAQEVTDLCYGLPFLTTVVTAQVG